MPVAGSLPLDLCILAVLHCICIHVANKVLSLSLPTRPKNHRICIDLRDDLEQKWGGHVHPVATPLAERRRACSMLAGYARLRTVN